MYTKVDAILSHVIYFNICLYSSSLVTVSTCFSSINKPFHSRKSCARRISFKNNYFTGTLPINAENPNFARNFNNLYLNSVFLVS